MNITAELLGASAGMAVGLVVERWATPWTHKLLRKGRITLSQHNRLWAILVVGSGLMTWTIVATHAPDLLK
jgi:hypothetical protein